jgi:hypothetical protein
MAAPSEKFVSRTWYAIDPTAFEVVVVEQIGHELVVTRPMGEPRRHSVAIDDTVQGAIKEWGGYVDATAVNPDRRDASSARAKFDALKAKAERMKENHLLQEFARRSLAGAKPRSARATRGLLSRLFAR